MPCVTLISMSGRPRVLSFAVNGPAIAGKWCLPGSSRSWVQRTRRLLQRPLNGTRCTRPHDSRCPCTCREPPVPGMVITTRTTGHPGACHGLIRPRTGMREDQARHPAATSSPPRTRAHEAMSCHNAPGRRQADTGAQGTRVRGQQRHNAQHTAEQEKGRHAGTDSGPVRGRSTTSSRAAPERGQTASTAPTATRPIRLQPGLGHNNPFPGLRVPAATGACPCRPVRAGRARLPGSRPSFHALP